MDDALPKPSPSTSASPRDYTPTLKNLRSRRFETSTRAFAASDFSKTAPRSSAPPHPRSTPRVEIPSHRTCAVSYPSFEAPALDVPPSWAHSPVSHKTLETRVRNCPHPSIPLHRDRARPRTGSRLHAGDRTRPRTPPRPSIDAHDAHSRLDIIHSFIHTVSAFSFVEAFFACIARAHHKYYR